MPRYVIIGAGSVGLALAARLTTGGRRALLVARGRSLAAIRQQGGVRYTDPTGSVLVDVPTVSGDEAQLEPGDVLVLAVKSQQSERTLGEWAWRGVTGGGVAADLPILTVQNGLATERMAIRRFRTVLGGSILIPAQSFDPGAVSVASVDPAAVLSIGLVPSGTSDQVDAVVADLVASGIAAHGTDDVQSWKVHKLLSNVMNGVDVLAGEKDERHQLGADLVAEARAVFAAADLHVADGEWRTREIGTFDIQPTEGWEPGRASTFQSFARGADSVELDYLNGEIVLLGRLHGVPTPVNAAIQRVLGASAARHEPPRTVSVADVRAAVR